VVRDHVDRVVRGLEVMSPRLEGFEDGEQFLVVGVVVELGTQEGTTVERTGWTSPSSVRKERMPAMA
jgi:hypothetical protein